MSPINPVAIFVPACELCKPVCEFSSLAMHLTDSKFSSLTTDSITIVANAREALPVDRVDFRSVTTF